MFRHGIFHSDTTTLLVVSVELSVEPLTDVELVVATVVSVEEVSPPHPATANANAPTISRQKMSQVSLETRLNILFSPN
jgi:hypothetical protein